MTLEEAIKLLKQYQGYEPMSPDGETLKHAFDLTDETVDTLLTALRHVSREQVNALDLGFDVIDAKTGEYPDLEKIALTEEWAQGLVYCDMDGFAVREDGSLILLDECGNCVSCPAERFEIRLLGGADDGRGRGDGDGEN